MYADQSVIKSQLEKSLVEKFGEKLKNDAFSLLDILSGSESYIENNLLLSLQNLLPLEKEEASYFVNLTLQLSTASIFAPILLLEKIPTLSFYDLTYQIGQFLLNIKNHGARAVALYLGSDETNTLRVEDLTDTLEQTSLPFYRALLNEVDTHNHQFGVCSAMIMRFAGKIETLINLEHIPKYLSVCAHIVKQYGTKIAEQYIRNAHEFVSCIPLECHIEEIDRLANYSLLALDFSVRYPKKVFPSKVHQTLIMEKEEAYAQSDLRGIALDILKHEDYASFLNKKYLHADTNFATLILSWPIFSLQIKANILFQLQNPDYKKAIQSMKSFSEPIHLINSVTRDNWFNSWMFAEAPVDLQFIRKRLGELLQRHEAAFSIPSKTLVKKHADIFDRSNTVYNESRVLNMVQALSLYCIDNGIQIELSAMMDFINGSQESYKKVLSERFLVIKTWERDPWNDYGRSDELFSCTSLGDYNAGNAPIFLADLNLNHLDIWSHGERIGRIHLCLVKDASNKTVLLLDCLDGSERLLSSQKKFESIQNAVLNYANFLGIKTIKLNYDVDFNATPKKFIDTIEKIYKGHEKVDFVSRYLKPSVAYQFLPYPSQPYLESFVKNDGGFIRGGLILLEKKDEYK